MEPRQFLETIGAGSWFDGDDSYASRDYDDFGSDFGY